jgi:PD-(D/E)XK nuclease superfamily
MIWTDGHIQIVDGYMTEFSPSWIKSMRMCPERQRQNTLARMRNEPELTTDSTIMGSATHKAMEMYLNGASKDDATEGALLCLKDLAEQGLVQLHRTTSPEAMVRTLRFFLNDLWSVLDHSEFNDIRVEESFKFEYGGLIFRGTADVVDVSNNRTWDLKTGVFKKELLWQSQRFDPQPTIYCYHWGTPNFRYAYLGGIAKEVRYDYVDVIRTGTGWMDMLVDEVNSWRQATDNFNINTPWPLSPGDWWCANSWCQNYDNCMGKHMDYQERIGK